MKCLNCGVEFKIGEEFCGECGTPRLVSSDQATKQLEANKNTPTDYYFMALKKYAVFDGRATRAEYWYFLLYNLIIGFILGFIEALSGNYSGESALALIYQLVILIPSVAIAVRRMHDVDKSGWYALIPIYNIILAATDGIKGNNKYGPDPKLL